MEDTINVNRKSLKMYIRNRKNHRIGVLYACVSPDKEVVFGWSLCNKKDVFNSYTGTTLAYERCMANDRYAKKNVRTILPHTVRNAPELKRFLQKVARYYKKDTPLHLFTDDMIYINLNTRVNWSTKR